MASGDAEALEGSSGFSSDSESEGESSLLEEEDDDNDEPEEVYSDLSEDELDEAEGAELPESGQGPGDEAKLPPGKRLGQARPGQRPLHRTGSCRQTKTHKMEGWGLHTQRKLE